jgi:hypothetical protein
MVQVLSLALGKNEASVHTKNTDKQNPEENQQYHALPLVQQEHYTWTLNCTSELYRELKSSFDATPESIASLDLVNAYNNADPVVEQCTILPMPTLYFQHVFKVQMQVGQQPMGIRYVTLTYLHMYIVTKWSCVGIDFTLKFLIHTWK